MKKVITIPMDKIDTMILMSIWYKEYMPLIGSERIENGCKVIDLMEMKEEEA